MRSLILSLLVLILTISTTNAQNGGQAPENNSVKLEFAGAFQCKLWNKQSCEAVITVKYNNTTTDYTVPGGSYVMINTPVPSKITAKTTTNCGSADFGLVELNITTTILPVKFVSFRTYALSGNRIKVQFEIGEAQNVKQFNVQISKDGRDWTTVALVWPDELQPNRVYETIVDLSNRK